MSEVVDLVSLPEIYFKVRELLDDPNSSMADISDVISVDPNLTSRILRIANSAFFNFAAEIGTVPQAMSLLGTQQIHDMVLATSVARSFSGIPQELVNMRRFWRYSVLCGANAKVIADNRDVFDSERLFTAGLLAHVGRLVLYLRLSNTVREAYSEVSQKGVTLQQALESKLGFDDAAVSGALLSSWKLPKSLVEPVRLHSHPGDSEEFALEAAILHVSSAIADASELQSDTDELIRHLDETAWLTLELSRDALLELKIDGENLADDIIQQFLPVTD